MMRACSADPRCPNLTKGGPCAQHAAAYESRRGTAHQRGYDSAHRATRARYRAIAPRNLAGALICENCATPEPPDGPELHLDHIDGLGPNGPNGHNLDNLQNLCHPCHGIKTAHQTGIAGGPQ